MGYDNVIIINAKDAVYGFPSKIEDDPVMKLVIKQSDEMDYAEERRLFYVALTRTKNRVFIIAPEKHPSEFVLELKAVYKNILLKGEFNPEPHGLITNKVCPICGYPLQRRHRKDCGMNLWVCTNEPEVCGFVSNNLVGGKMYIQKCTECVDGYLIVKTKDGHPFLGCTNYTRDGKGCNSTISPQAFDASVKDNEIMEIEVVEEIQSEKEEPITKQLATVDEQDYKFEDECVSATSDDTDDDESTANETIAEEVVRLIINACAEISKINYFGATMLVDVLRGSKRQQVLNYKLDELGCYGVLKSIKRKYVLEIVELLIEENFLYRTQSSLPTVRVNEGKSVDDVHNMDLSIVEEIIVTNSTMNKSRVQVPDGETIVVEGWDVYVDESGMILTDIELLNRLQAIRKKISETKNIPYYCVAWDKVLVRLATKKPTTKEEFLSIKGIRDRWFDNNGEEFLQEIKDYLKNEKTAKSH